MAEIRGVQQVVRNLGKIKAQVFDRIVTACQITQARIVNDARAICPVHLTTLRQSILPGNIDVSRDNVKAYVVANADYAAYVEYGTRPHFPPVEALKDWAARKLGDEGLAFPVARAISERGTRPQPFLGPAMLKNQTTFRREIAKAVKL